MPCEVRPGPVDQDHEPVAESNQIDEVDNHPEPPRYPALKSSVAQLDDRGAPADGGQRPIILVTERWPRAPVAFERSTNRSADIGSHLLRRGCNPRNRSRGSRCDI